MAEIGIPMEVPKMRLTEKVGALFSRRLAEKQWVMNHREQIQQYAKVAETLPEEQRAQVMAKIEQDMREATGKKVLIGRTVGGIVLTAATFVGALIGIKPFRELVGKIPKIGGALEKFGTKGKDFLKKMIDRPLDWVAKKVPLNVDLKMDEGAQAVAKAAAEVKKA